MAVSWRRRRREILSGYLYLAPAVLFIGALIIYPLIKAVQYSLQSWDGVGIARWVGLSNYTQVFTDSVERGSLVNLGILLVFYALIPVALALIVVNLMLPGRGLGHDAGQGSQGRCRRSACDGMQVDDVADHEAVMPGARFETHGVVKRQCPHARIRS
jgi:hypothetical protein